MKRHRGSLTYLFLFVLSLALLLQGCMPAAAPEETMARFRPAMTRRPRYSGCGLWACRTPGSRRLATLA